jgi:hypothetical protein
METQMKFPVGRQTGSYPETGFEEVGRIRNEKSAIWRGRSEISQFFGWAESPTAITHDPPDFPVLSSVWQSHGNH